jgi:hypothetical protein
MSLDSFSYSQLSKSGVVSPGPRDMPRLPLSVSEIANRYQPPTDTSPYRGKSPPPSTDRHLSSRDVIPRDSIEEPLRQEQTSLRYAPGPISSSPVSGEDEFMGRGQDRVDKLDEKEIMDREKELRDRELELERRTRELEARLMTVRGGNQGSPISQPPRSYSTTHLSPPPTASASQSQLSLASTHSPSRQTKHAEFCGCETCSVAKYKTRSPPSPLDSRPMEPPINLRPDKPKGWIRRLSMPMGFSLDSSSKKTHQANTSSGNIRSSLALEDGRLERKSFEPGGPGNRSMINLQR